MIVDFGAAHWYRTPGETTEHLYGSDSFLAPDGAGTKVTWAMDGPTNFMSKFMCIFVSMDKMVGGDFEKGLASLKRIAEPVPAAR